MLWLLTLPFALWPIMGPSMVPACLFISYVSCARVSQASCANYHQECLWPFRKAVSLSHGNFITKWASFVHLLNRMLDDQQQP